jgi:hypothetical protein
LGVLGRHWKWTLPARIAPRRRPNACPSSLLRLKGRPNCSNPSPKDEGGPPAGLLLTPGVQERPHASASSRLSLQALEQRSKSSLESTRSVAVGPSCFLALTFSSVECDVFGPVALSGRRGSSHDDPRSAHRPDRHPRPHQAASVIRLATRAKGHHPGTEGSPSNGASVLILHARAQPRDPPLVHQSGSFCGRPVVMVGGPTLGSCSLLPGDASPAFWPDITGAGRKPAMLDVTRALNIPEWLATLHSADLLDTPPEGGFDEFARLATPS